MDEIAELLGRRKGVSLYPLDLAVVMGRPKRHPDLGHAINLTCELRNELDRDEELRAIEASATGPGDLEFDFNWRLVFDSRGLEHERRIERETKIAIPARQKVRTGIQLTAPVLTDEVRWPAGGYEIQLRGWVNRGRSQGPANLRTRFHAEFDHWGARQVLVHARLSDKDWKSKGYSDEAVGFPFQLSDVRCGLPAS